MDEFNVPVREVSFICRAFDAHLHQDLIKFIIDNACNQAVSNDIGSNAGQKRSMDETISLESFVKQTLKVCLALVNENVLMMPFFLNRFGVS